MSPTRPVLWSLLASLALGCNAGRDTGDDSGDDSGDDTADTADTDTADTSDTDTGTTFTCPADDTLEENDDSETATALTAGTDIDAQLCEGDSDFFAIAVPQDCIVEATLDFDAPTVDFDFYLYDALELIGYSESSENDETIVLRNAGAATTWFLEAYPYEGEGAYSVGFHCATTTCTDDDNEPNDDIDHAAALTGGTAEGAQSCLANDDWYAITVGAGCDVDVHLDFAQADGDLDLALTDVDTFAAGDFLVASGSEDDDEDVSYSNDGPTTTYYALVRPYSAAEAAYTITATLTNCAPACDDVDDDVAENDDPLTAVALTEDPALTGQVCAYDEDWYALTSKFGCDVEVNLTYTNADGDLDLFLYDVDENFEDSSTGTTGTETVTFNNRLGSEDATLYAKVAGDQADQNDYSITMVEDCNPCEDDAGEEGAGNDTKATAIALPADTDFEGAVCAGDEDWFVVTAASGCKVTATLDIDDPTAHDLDLSFLDDDGDVLDASASFDEDEKVIHRINGLDDASPLVLKVVGDLGAEDTYTLSYTVDCEVCTDAAETPVANDTSATAHPITEGNTFDARSCGGVDDDWFSFTPTSGCEGIVTLVTSGFDSEVHLSLYDEGAVLHATSAEESNTQVVFYDNGDDDYAGVLIKASYYAGDEPNYTLLWEEDCTTCNDDGSDDTLAAPTALVEGVAVDDAICEDDIDVYSLTVGAGCGAYVQVEAESVRGDIDVYLYPPGATDLYDDAIDASWVGGDHEWLYDINEGVAAATFKIHVEAFAETGDPTADNDYTVKFSEICECPEDAEAGANVDRANAFPITPNDPAYEGGLCTEDDSDWFSFTAGADCTVEAMLIAMGYNETSTVERGDLDLFLHDADGELTSAETGNNVETLRYLVGPDDEDLFVEVYAYGLVDDLGMPYELHVDTICP